jgi:hypothetical protein
MENITAKTDGNTGVHQALAETVTAMKSALARLQDYLASKTAELDPMALSLASKRGQTDTQEYFAMSDRCAGRHDACMNKDLEARLMVCSRPTWLPF